MRIPMHVIKVICLLLVSVVLSSQTTYAALSTHEFSYEVEAIDNERHCDTTHMMSITAEENCCDPLESNIENQCCFSNAAVSYALIFMSSLNSRQPYTLGLIHRDSFQASFAIPDLLYRPPIA